MIVKSGAIPAGGAVAPQEPVRGRVEGAAVHALTRREPTSRSTRDSISCDGAARERQQEDPLGRHPAIDQVRDAMDERTRLAGPGAGDDEQRPVAVRRARPLCLVELGGEIARFGRGDGAMARLVEAGRVRHGP